MKIGYRILLGNWEVENFNKQVSSRLGSRATLIIGLKCYIDEKVNLWAGLGYHDTKKQNTKLR